MEKLNKKNIEKYDKLRKTDTQVRALLLLADAVPVFDISKDKGK